MTAVSEAFKKWCTSFASNKLDKLLRRQRLIKRLFTDSQELQEAFPNTPGEREVMCELRNRYLNKAQALCLVRSPLLALLVCVL